MMSILGKEFLTRHGEWAGFLSRVKPRAIQRPVFVTCISHRLVGINGAQLAIALIANVFLLLNMAQSVRFSIAQPITVCGWWISSFVLMGLCATANGPMKLPDPSTQEFSQAFYYGIISAALYFVVAILMTVTVAGAIAGKYEKNFQLTMSQRTLMLQTISLLAYLEISAVIYSRVEGWSFLDSV